MSGATTVLVAALLVCGSIGAGSFYVARHFLNEAWRERGLVRYLMLCCIVTPAVTAGLGTAAASLVSWYAFFKA